MNPHTTILTPTYNKPEYLPDAANGVFRQTDPGWQWWIVLDGACEATRRMVYGWAASESRIRVFDEPTTDESRRERYRPAVIVNRYYPMIQTDFMAWHSDDDVWEPRFLELLAGHLRANPDHDVAVGTCNRVRLSACGDEVPYVKPKLDGGQVVHTRRAYESLDGWMLPDGWNSETNHLDGLFLEQLAARFVFHSVPDAVVTHRRTPLSTHGWRKKK